MPRLVGIGVTGGIAAYKIADLVSQLSKQEDIEVSVIMTESATRFISPLTFRTLSNREVHTDLWQESPGHRVQHIGLAQSMDLFVVAPATANIIGKMAAGIADDLLSTMLLATNAPILAVPSMNSGMYENPVVQRNLNTLRDMGIHILEPDSGYLACGDAGKGRLPDNSAIYERIMSMLQPGNDLQGLKIMVNAGTTCENIDPVRFITNRGTGKMGFAIARAARRRGANVILVSGPSQLQPPPGVLWESVWSAEEMCEKMLGYQDECNIIIGAAAVGDFKVARTADQKIKKSGNASDRITLELVQNPDIIKTLGARKKMGQIIIGFAAETQNVMENARKKLESKNLDFIVANDVTMEGAGFAIDTNIVTIITRDGEIRPYPKMTKDQVAEAILDKAADLFKTINCDI